MPVSIVLLGGSGMLGSEVRRFLGQDCWSPDPSELDISNPLSVAQIVDRRPECIINCAAYTAVDLAETMQDEAFRTNALGPAYLAKAATMVDAHLIHISTDYVFDGRSSSPYIETDSTNPLGVYGRSKLEGEDAVRANCANHTILRTAWLFGENGQNFPMTILKAARAGKSLRVVADQWGSPTWARDFAEIVVAFRSGEYERGLYHAAGPQKMSWFELARLTLEVHGIKSEIEPILASDWPTPAPRPAWSVLDCPKLNKLGLAVPPIKEGLSQLRIL